VVCVDNFFIGTRANAAASLAHKRFELLRDDATSRSTSRLTKSITLRVRLRRFITSTIRCRPRKPASTVRQPKPESGLVANFEEGRLRLVATNGTGAKPAGARAVGVFLAVPE
jgi:hypothetical protein